MSASTSGASLTNSFRPFRPLPKVFSFVYAAAAGEPKIPLRAESLLARGLMRLDTAQRPPRLFFTEHGLSALHAMMRDRRLADPVRFAHVRRELGIDPAPANKATD